MSTRAPADGEMLAERGWASRDPLGDLHRRAALSRFIRGSRGEFSVAKDLNVRLATGWFSDRSACYLAAGRPVVMQDTGFRRTLPVGAGLLAFRTPEEAVDALRIAVDDWALHAAAARRIAEQHFNAEWVLAEMLGRAGV